MINHGAIYKRFRVLPTLIVLFLATLMFNLGLWQLKRADEKKAILAQQEALAQESPHDYLFIDKKNSIKYTPVTVTGTFDNPHSFLLDNKTLDGRVGYDVLTPLHIKGSQDTMLINRGWIARGKTRHDLPALKSITGTVTIQGFLDQPGNPLQLNDQEESNRQWPHIIQRIDTSVLSHTLGYPITPYVLQLRETSDYTYRLHWQVVYGQPSRHIGYAVQWFAFTAILLLGYCILCMRKET